MGKNLGFAQAEVFDDDEEEEDSPRASFSDEILAPPPPPPPSGLINSTAIEEGLRAQERPLPSPILPDFWAVLFLAVVVIFNALMWFIQRWSIRVRARVQYQEAPALEAGTFAYVTPHLHQGAAAIVPVEYIRMGGSVQRFFIFQRQKYEIDEAGKVVSAI